MILEDGMRNKPDYIPIEGQPDLFRDPRSQAVLQTNVKAKEAYNKQREDRRKIQSALSEIDSLKDDVKEMKSLIKLILQKLT